MFVQFYTVFHTKSFPSQGWLLLRFVIPATSTTSYQSITGVAMLLRKFTPHEGWFLGFVKESMTGSEILLGFPQIYTE